MNSSWATSTIGDVMTLNYGKNLPVKQRTTGNTPVYGSNGIVGSHNIPLVNDRGIIVGRKGSVGEVRLSMKPFCAIDTTYYVTRDDTKLDLIFAYYLLRYLNLKRISSDVGVPGLNREMAYRESIAYPKNMNEQQNIAAILWKIQQAIELQEKLVATTNELKQAAMRQLFTKGLRGEKQKETEIDAVPESWEVVKLESVLNKGMQNGAFIKRPNIGKGLHYVNVVDMYDEIYVNTGNLERIDVNKMDVEQYLLENGDVLFVRSSLKREGIGQSCTIRELEEEAFFDCHLIRISPDTAKILPEWIVYYWRSAPGKEELIRRSKTTTMTTINQQSLGEALLPLPSLGEQKAIIDTLLTIDASIQFRNRKKQALSSLFQTTLHELMTGQIRVTDLKIDISDII